ncbi:hypothetical protein TNCV_3469441 [Trichonephila clavipes]|nr:hypothetical protein TNCV_3469441 [Trichonephila clavipes]
MRGPRPEGQVGSSTRNNRLASNSTQRRRSNTTTVPVVSLSWQGFNNSSRDRESYQNIYVNQRNKITISHTSLPNDFSPLLQCKEIFAS